MATGVTPTASACEDGTAVTSYEHVDAWLAAVISSPNLTPGTKVIAAALKLRFNFKTYLLNPSVLKIATDTRQRRRSVEKQLEALAAAKFLDWQGSKGRTSNRYRLLLTPAHWRELVSLDPARWAEVNSRRMAGIPDRGTSDNSRPADHQLPPMSATTAADGREELLRTSLNTSRAPAHAPTSAPGAQELSTLKSNDRNRLLAAGFAPDQVQAWFAHAEFALVGDELRVTVQKPVVRNWVANKFVGRLEKAWASEGARSVVVVVNPMNKAV